LKAEIVSVRWERYGINATGEFGLNLSGASVVDCVVVIVDVDLLELLVA
jgi:hypothetical protein